MSVSLDSDVVRKLAAYELLTQAPAAFGCQPDDCRVLPTLKFQLKLNDAAKALTILGSQVAVDEVTTFVAQAKEITDVSVSAANLVLALDLDGLDAGEQTLIAWLLTEHHHLMLTGDKRAICALGRIDPASPIVQHKQRIRCLETIMLRLVEHLGFQPTSDAVRSRPDADTALRAVFGNSVASDEDSVLSGLHSYVAHLVTSSNGFYVANVAP